MAIKSSTYQADPPDALGRCQVVERHIDHTGREHMVVYTKEPGLDADAIMSQRAARIGAEVDRAEAEAAIASGGAVITSWTKKEFWLRVTPQEYAACKGLCATDAVADYYWQVLQAAEYIMPGDPVLLAGLEHFEDAGCCAPGRAAEIGNG